MGSATHRRLLSLSGMVTELSAGEATVPAPGIALAIVYDTSGSMKNSVRSEQGVERPKYQIAAEALRAIVDQLEAVVAQRRREGSGSFALKAGLITFRGKNVTDAVPFGDFSAASIRRWLDRQAEPKDSTPLGRAVELAGSRVLGVPLARKHILVVTDGVNTAGPDPASEITKLRARAKAQGAVVGIHFVAFDVQAQVFDPVKQLDCTVLAAANGVELKRTLETVLAEKILLEDEETPAAAPLRKVP
jgi:von Willebrand factor type A domain